MPIETSNPNEFEIQTYKPEEVKKQSFIWRFLGNFREEDNKRGHKLLVSLFLVNFLVQAFIVAPIVVVSSGIIGFPILTAIGTLLLIGSTGSLLSTIILGSLFAGISLLGLLAQLEAPGSFYRFIDRIHEVAKAQADKSSARPLKVLRYLVTMVAGLAASILMPLAHVFWNSWYKANNVMDSLRKNGWIWGSTPRSYSKEEGYTNYHFPQSFGGKLGKACYHLIRVLIAFPLTVVLYPFNIIWQALPDLPIELKLFLLAALGGLTLAAVLVASHGLAMPLLAPAGAWLLGTGLLSANALVVISSLVTGFSLAGLYNVIAEFDVQSNLNEYIKYTKQPFLKPFAYLVGILHSAVVICFAFIPVLISAASHINHNYLRQRRLIPGLTDELKFEDAVFNKEAYYYYPFQSNYKGYFGRFVYSLSFLALLPLVAVGIPFYVTGKAVNKELIIPLRDKINTIRYPGKMLVLSKADLLVFFLYERNHLSYPDDITLEAEKDFLTEHMRSNYQASVKYTNFEKDLSNLIKAYFAKEVISTKEDLQNKFTEKLTAIAQSNQTDSKETLSSIMLEYFYRKYRFPLNQRAEFIIERNKLIETAYAEYERLREEHLNKTAAEQGAEASAGALEPGAIPAANAVTAEGRETSSAQAAENTGGAPVNVEQLLQAPSSENSTTAQPIAAEQQGVPTHLERSSSFGSFFAALPQEQPLKVGDRTSSPDVL